MAGIDEDDVMASRLGLEQPLLSHSRPSSSLLDGLAARRLAKFVLRLRFSTAVFQSLSIDTISLELARPIAILLGLTVAMLLSTAYGLMCLDNMSNGLAQTCIAFDGIYLPSRTIASPATWTNDTISVYAEFYPNNDDVVYEYVVVNVVDAMGKGVGVAVVHIMDVMTRVSQSPPYHIDVSHAEFPLTMTLVHENEVIVAHIIRYNFPVQWSCLAWMALSWFCLWGYFGASVLAPGVHAVQQGSAWLIVYSASKAMQHPIAVTPSLGDHQQQIYDRCKGSDHGLSVYGAILLFQTIIALFLPWAAELVRGITVPLISYSRAFKGIKVVQQSNGHSNGTCPICLDLLDVDVDMIWALPCSHTYHKDCVLPWLTKPGESLGTCPVCRGNHANGM